jgi:hypothetical protein
MNDIGTVWFSILSYFSLIKKLKSRIIEIFNKEGFTQESHMDEETPLLMEIPQTLGKIPKKRFVVILLLTCILTISIILIFFGIILLTGFTFCNVTDMCKNNNFETYMKKGFLIDFMVLGIILIVLLIFQLALRIIYYVLNKKIEL